MPRKNPHRPFSPAKDFQAAWPDISGNEINGLYEQDFRRPRPVYWAVDPDDIVHGDVQRHFYKRSATVPAFTTARQDRIAKTQAPDPPIASTIAEHTPNDWTVSLQAFVQYGVCDMIGVAEMSPDWVYEGQTVPQSRIIVVGVQHDYEEIAKAPHEDAGLEVVAQYTRAAVASKQIKGWLHTQGWAAEAITGPMTGSLTLIPPALACGFGELGKHGSLINPEFGASFRLSAVLTDAPFAPTPSRSFGIDAFCQNCRICEDACPPEALFPEKKTVRGIEKWYVDFDKCIPFFNETHGCAICIAQCPWSRPGVGMNLASKLARRQKRSDSS